MHTSLEGNPIKPSGTNFCANFIQITLSTYSTVQDACVGKGVGPCAEIFEQKP